ncbi:caa(3)-type oxidase, subunit IV [Fodinibius salinus]|uniref:Caa(3)-type oxidase, subunit IV n=1 Tax=Fodinibius salinus TaxID=860790 RepID=A0A5D3YIV3_9BACT|nr:cytochrome C oxidase subunit IV family protein [Fodinibius salinus]TYP92665.1 caa(3)-type oxidase, subunit IV [Fodinibius salinus]
MSGHHISTDKTLLGVAGALFILTILTVGVHYIHIPEPWSIIVAMGIAIFKATLVAAFFMNLYWDERFNTMLFIASIAFFGLLVGLTLLDTLFRPEVMPAF